MDPNALIPGDVLLYAPSNLLGVIIAIKTADWFSHVEVVCDKDRVIGARMEGVDVYPMRVDKYLRCVRRHIFSRPDYQFNDEAAFKAVQPYLGKPYEIGGLFSFFTPLAKTRHVHRICSVIVNEYLKGGGLQCFNPEIDIGRVSPADFWQTPELLTIWKAPSV